MNDDVTTPADFWQTVVGNKASNKVKDTVRLIYSPGEGAYTNSGTHAFTRRKQLRDNDDDVAGEYDDDQYRYRYNGDGHDEDEEGDHFMEMEQGADEDFSVDDHDHDHDHDDEYGDGDDGHGDGDDDDDGDDDIMNISLPCDVLSSKDEGADAEGTTLGHVQTIALNVVSSAADGTRKNDIQSAGIESSSHEYGSVTPSLNIQHSGKSAESLYSASIASQSRRNHSVDRPAYDVRLPVPSLHSEAKRELTALADEAVVVGLCGELVSGSEPFMFNACRPRYPCALLPLDVVFESCAPFVQHTMDLIAAQNRDAAMWLNSQLTVHMHMLGMDVFAQTQALLCSQHVDDLSAQWQWLHNQAVLGDRITSRPPSLATAANTPAKFAQAADAVWHAVQKDHHIRTKERTQVRTREEMIEATLQFAFPVTAIVAQAIEQCIEHAIQRGDVPHAQAIRDMLSGDAQMAYVLTRARLTAAYWNPGIATTIADLVLYSTLHQRAEYIDSLKAKKPLQGCRTSLALCALIDLPEPCTKWVDRMRNHLYPQMNVAEIEDIVNAPQHVVGREDVNASRKFARIAEDIDEEMKLLRQLVPLPFHPSASLAEVGTMLLKTKRAELDQMIAGDRAKHLQYMAAWRWVVASRFSNALRRVIRAIENKLRHAASQARAPPEFIHRLGSGGHASETGAPLPSSHAQ